MGEQSTVGQVFELPSDVNSLSEYFKKDIHLCKSIYGVVKNSLQNGRNLNSVTILAFGESGSGKSTTINKIFNDKKLCQTGELKSTTTAISIIRKKLVAECDSNSNSVLGNLCFVDTPGTFDTNGNDEEYMNLLKCFRDNDPLLTPKQRKARPGLSFIPGGPIIRSNVYPNIVLFFISADTKIEGDATRIYDSLKRLKFADLVDSTYPNLIVVVTRGLQFLGEKDYSDEESEETDETDGDDDDEKGKSFNVSSLRFKEVVQKAVKKIFNFENCPVAIVENHPLGVLHKNPNTDYYYLPNGQLSHHNVLLAITEVFKSRRQFNDTLGQLLVGTYLDLSCPERKQKAEVQVFNIKAYLKNPELRKGGSTKQTYNMMDRPSVKLPGLSETRGVKNVKSFDYQNHPLLANKQEVTDAFASIPKQFQHQYKSGSSYSSTDVSSTEESDMDEELKSKYMSLKKMSHTPFYFDYLTHGITLQSGEIKPTNLLGRDNGQKMIIGTQEYSIPTVLSVHSTNKTTVQSSTFNKKKKLEEDSFIFNMRQFLPMIQNTCNLKIHCWNSAKAKDRTMYCFVIEKSLVLCKMEEPEVILKQCTSFQNEIQNLIQDSETEQNCEAFLERWGTDFVTQQEIGGGIYVFCSFKPSLLKKMVSSDDSYKQAIDAEFKSLFTAQIDPTKFTKIIKNIKGKGVKEEQIIIKGGQTDGTLFNFESLTSDIINKWHETMVENPASLMGGIKTFPHYLLIRDDPEKRSTLQQATENYIKTISMKQLTQKEMSNHLKNQAKLENEKVMEEENCFPEGTSIYLYEATEKNMYEKPIEYLSHGDRLHTTKLNLAKYSRPTVNESSMAITGTQFCTYLHKAPKKVVNYLCLKFSNGKELVVSDNHLVITVDKQRAIAKRAVEVQLGDVTFFAQPSNANQLEKVELTSCVNITRKTCIGAYAPLTFSGTFFANGFLVTSYADVDSFLVAHLSLAPLKLLSIIRPQFIGKSKLKENDKMLTVRETEKDEINPYARLLMRIRDIGRFSE